MRIVLLCIGLLAGSSSVLAQTKKTPATSTPDTAGKLVVPVRPPLPGEEKLSARERVERDFLMPVRRRTAPAAKPTSAPAASASSAVPTPGVPTPAASAPAPASSPDAPRKKSASSRR